MDKIHYFKGIVLTAIAIMVTTTVIAIPPQSHTFWSCDGGNIEVGENITAYDPDGILSGSDIVTNESGCGTYFLLECNGDDPDTSGIDEGAEPGDIIRFYVNGNLATTNPPNPTWSSGSTTEINLTVCQDSDGDGYGDCPRCNVTSGCTSNGDDCNDTNGSINPGATEVCNGVDDDCDGSYDEAFDSDGDNYTTCGTLTTDGSSVTADCDDTNASINPGAAEIYYNGVDDDCNASTIDCDQDDDGFNANATASGGVCAGNDCNDTNASIHPGAWDICNNAVDEDCYGGPLICGQCQDADGDGYGFCPNCNTTNNCTSNGSDCDDTSASINPEAIEICDDNRDNDCDGDEDMADANCSSCIDNDTDGYYVNCTLKYPDCNDDPDSGGFGIHPGATESCSDKIDNDCDGLIDCCDTDECPCLAGQLCNLFNCICYTPYKRETKGGLPSGVEEPTKEMELDIAGQFVNESVIITVTDADTGSVLVGANVAVYYAIDGELLHIVTDQNGQVEFTPGEDGRYDITVSMYEYKPATDTINVVKKECADDSECAGDKYCSDGKCVPVECPCGEVSDHKCTAYDCCADADCEPDEVCEDNKCVPKIFELSIIGPSDVVVGEEVEYTVLDENGDAVSNAITKVTYEDGTEETLTTDENGVVKFTVSASGSIIIDAEKEGYQDTQMSALATKAGCVSDAECPAGEICEDGVCVKKPPSEIPWIWIIVGLIIIVLLIVFFLFMKKRGKVTITKERIDDRVLITIKNETKKDLEGVIVEDVIPGDAEVKVEEVPGMASKRKKNKITWDIGVLESGGERVIEYSITGAEILPPSRVTWDEGMEISE